MKKPDVLIIGAGMAGAAAARALSREGRTALILEARDRVGGRGYLKPFPGGPDLEYGGGWITPWQHRIRALAAEHGLTLRARDPVTLRRWFYDGALHDEPVPKADRAAHERTLARVAADSILLKKGHATDEKDRPLRGVSFADYLDRIAAPEATRHLFSAWWTVSGNGDKAKVPASEFLSSCAYEGGLAETMIDCWTDSLVPGYAVLVDRLIKAAGADLRLSTPVSAITAQKAGVRITTATGDTHEAPFCIVALGINQLRDIAFGPPLPAPRQQAIARGHEGSAFKLWVRARGIQPGTLVTGDGSGIEFAFAERATEDGVMLVCFGLSAPASDPADPAWVKAEIGRLFPNAEVLAHDFHDWVADPWSRGTWVAAPLGAEDGLDWQTWTPLPRLAFATSDTAREGAGWFEAAIIAGEDAAKAAVELR